MLAPPEWLIEKVIPEGGLIGIYGQPAAGKSFTSIDLAMCVATGTPWQGRAVRPGFVLYISAEGGRGIGKRVLAWLAAHQMDLKDADIGWLIEAIPVNVDSDEMAIVFDRIVNEIGRQPVLIIIDTLARCFSGDENLQEDMGRFIAGVDWLRHELGCAVTVIHHTNLSGLRERGNTAFRGATDTMLMLEKEGRVITISCSKQRDDEEFEPIELELCPIEGTDSCVVVPSTQASKKDEAITTLVQTLRNVGPCKWDVWMDALTAGGLDKKVFFKYRADLKRFGVLKQKDGLWTVQTRQSGVPTPTPL